MIDLITPIQVCCSYIYESGVELAVGAISSGSDKADKVGSMLQHETAELTLFWEIRVRNRLRGRVVLMQNIIQNEPFND